MSACQSQMKVPLRPAPPPPVDQKLPPKSTSDWNGFDDNRWNKSFGPPQKKKPPPRPPPPKFSNKKSVPSRPSQLITGLFQRKNNVNAKINEVQVNRIGGDVIGDIKSTGNGPLLIDFSSPPSSPTFTTRSSSDALSVNSFGSDGVAQYSNSSGTSSNVESGFEDDFDIFSNGTRRTENGCQPRDPWSPPPKVPEPKNPVKSWATFPSPGSSKKIPFSVQIMPTIIRSKPDGHNKSHTKIGNGDVHSKVLVRAFESKEPSSNESRLLTGEEEEEEDEDLDDVWSSESPPMPTCPPPPPPPTIYNDLFQNSEEVKNAEKPNGIALYDYPGEAPEDLSFKKEDIIYLVRRIDENWLVGRSKDGREGTVPANFVSIRVPPPGEENIFVTALYAFQAETWDDLVFEEGSVIKVSHRIDQDWLYGECNGKRGQFPANFVDRVPEGLPTKRTDC